MRPLYGYRIDAGIATVDEPRAAVVRAVLAERARGKLGTLRRAALAVGLARATPTAIKFVIARIRRHRAAYSAGIARAGLQPNPALRLCEPGINDARR